MLSYIWSCIWREKIPFPTYDERVRTISDKYWHDDIHVDGISVRRFLTSQTPMWLATLESIYYYSMIQDEIKKKEISLIKLEPPKLDIVVLFCRQLIGRPITKRYYEDMVKVVYSTLAKTIPLSRPLNLPETNLLFMRLEYSFSLFETFLSEVEKPKKIQIKLEESESVLPLFVDAKYDETMDPLISKKTYTNPLVRELSKVRSRMLGVDETIVPPVIIPTVHLISDFGNRRSMLENLLAIRPSKIS